MQRGSVTPPRSYYYYATQTSPKSDATTRTIQQTKRTLSPLSPRSTSTSTSSKLSSRSSKPKRPSQIDLWAQQALPETMSKASPSPPPPPVTSPNDRDDVLYVEVSPARIPTTRTRVSYQPQHIVNGNNNIRQSPKRSSSGVVVVGASPASSPTRRTMITSSPLVTSNKPPPQPQSSSVSPPPPPPPVSPSVVVNIVSTPGTLVSSPSSPPRENRGGGDDDNYQRLLQENTMLKTKVQELTQANVYAKEVAFYREKAESLEAQMKTLTTDASERENALRQMIQALEGRIKLHNESSAAVAVPQCEKCIDLKSLQAEKEHMWVQEMHLFRAKFEDAHKRRESVEIHLKEAEQKIATLEANLLESNVYADALQDRVHELEAARNRPMSPKSIRFEVSSSSRRSASPSSGLLPSDCSACGLPLPSHKAKIQCRTCHRVHCENCLQSKANKAMNGICHVCRRKVSSSSPPRRNHHTTTTTTNPPHSRERDNLPIIQGVDVEEEGGDGGWSAIDDHH
eukprot:PhF_6_TR42173/c0_g1_i2/m.63768